MANWYKSHKFDSYKVILSGKPRYKGQLQGDEYRPGDVAFMERMEENDIIEGQYVARMRAMIKNKKWNELNNYVEQLKTEGHSSARVQSMLTRAMHGTRL